MAGYADAVAAQQQQRKPNLMAALGNRPMSGGAVTPRQPVGNNPYSDPGFSQPASMGFDDFFKWADTQTSTPAQLPTLAPGASKSYEELMASTPGFSTPSGGTAVGAPQTDPGGHQAMETARANMAFGEMNNPSTPTVDPTQPDYGAMAAGMEPQPTPKPVASGSPGSPVMQATAGGTPPVTPTLPTGDLDTFFREADGAGPGASQVTRTAPEQVNQNVNAWLAANMPGADFPSQNAVQAMGDAFNTGGFDAFFKQADAANAQLGSSVNEAAKATTPPPPAGGIGIPVPPVNDPVQGDMTQPGTQEAVDQTAVGGAPVVEQPAITDYSEALKEAGIPAAIEALGAANPYDTRRDEILGGQQAMIDEEYRKARELLVHQAGVMNRLESPAFAANLKELTNDYTLAKLGLQSQFGQQAAAADENIRRGRVQDVLGAIDPEYQRTQQSLGFQGGIQAQANQDYANYMGLYNQAQQAPQNQQAKLLQLAMQGLGYTTPASFSGAMQGNQNVAGMAGMGMQGNANAVSNIFGSPYAEDLLSRLFRGN